MGKFSIYRGPKWSLDQRKSEKNTLEFVDVMVLNERILLHFQDSFLSHWLSLFNKAADKRQLFTEQEWKPQKTNMFGVCWSDRAAEVLTADVVNHEWWSSLFDHAEVPPHRRRRHVSFMAHIKIARAPAVIIISLSAKRRAEGSAAHVKQPSPTV